MTPGPSPRGAEVRIVVRPIGVPLPLAFSALAVGSLLVSAQELGWIGADADLEIGIVLVALVFPLQLMSAIFGFLARDPVAGTGVALVAAAWLVAGAGRIIPEADSDPIGLALVAVAVAMLVPITTAALGKLVVAALMALTAMRFALSGVYAITDAGAVGDVAGAVGLAVVALSLYCALALELEALGHPDLPLLRRGQALESIVGSEAEQFAGIEHETGVRRRI